MQLIDYKTLTPEQREAYGFVRLTNAKLSECGYMRTAAGQVKKIKRTGSNSFKLDDVQPIAAGNDKQ